MGDPIPRWNGVRAEQRAGDLAIRGSVEATVKRAQSEDEAVSPCLEKRRWIWAWGAAVQCAPQAQHGGHSHLEQPIKGKESFTK
jgi:hypothetical protein